MDAGEPKSGEAFDAAVSQLAKVHARAHSDAGLADSCVEAGTLNSFVVGNFKHSPVMPKHGRLLKQ